MISQSSCNLTCWFRFKPVLQYKFRLVDLVCYSVGRTHQVQEFKMLPDCTSAAETPVILGTTSSIKMPVLRLTLVDYYMATLAHTSFECQFKILVSLVTFP